MLFAQSITMKTRAQFMWHIVPFFVLSLFAIPIFGMSYIELSKYLGVRAMPVEVVGTGSMYPSLFWSTSEGGPEDEVGTVIEEYRTTPHLFHKFSGITLLGRTYLRSELKHGDMVAFKNQQTHDILGSEGKDTANGFIKRIVGKSGDKIELRDGYVFKNGELLSEPYIYHPRSTYGGSTLKDCEVKIVPEGELFVLGDNRKVSSDSRFELGFIKESDVEYYLPLDSQKRYIELWRDTTKDASLMGISTLSPAEFIKYVNAERANLGAKNLRIEESLNRSSSSRAKKLLQDQNTAYSLKQAVDSVGYSNVLIGEFVSQGHFSASELFKSLLVQSSMKAQIFSSDYTDIGLSAVTGDIDGCPAQFIVGHLGGYVPADYDLEMVKSWQDLSINLGGVIQSWQKALEYEGIDKAKVQSLISLLQKRQSLASEIVEVMQSRKWLTKEQESRIQNDARDAKQAEIWAEELNK